MEFPEYVVTVTILLNSGTLLGKDLLLKVETDISKDFNFRTYENYNADEETWLEKRTTHKSSRIDSERTFEVFAEDLANEHNFAKNLDAIMIQRTVASKNHKKVQRHIKTVMKNNGWAVEEDKFRDQTPYGEKPFNNIIATLDPSAPRRLVLACHYDSKIDPPGVYAIDSAVPCAMMLNLATTMKDWLDTLRSDLTLQFIFFDGEEAFVKWSDTDSLYGARHLAKKWENKPYTSGGVTGNYNDRIDLFVLLDLLGSTDMQISREMVDTKRFYDRLVSIERSLKKHKMVAGPSIFKDKAGSGTIQDDHVPFQKRGVPILHLIATTNVRPGFPKVWHTMDDNRDALDFQKIENLNKIMRLFVVEYLRGSDSLLVID